MISTAEAATGKWFSILRSLGIDESYLRDVHGPCPLCKEGEDRYRWDNRNGSGSYICGQCGAGYGIDLAMKFLGLDFKEAARLVDEQIQNAPFEKPKERDTEKIRRDLNETWSGGNVNASFLRDYLRGRGIEVCPPTLRGHPALEYWHKGSRLGRYPAMLARISGPDGSAQSIHRTYFGGTVPLIPAKKFMPPITDIKGGAIRLFPEAAELALTEGIETALSVHQCTGMPVWATMSAGGMESIILPPSVKVVHIYGDNDESMTGQKAAYTLAHRLVLEKRLVVVYIPRTAGLDWNDAHVSGAWRLEMGL